MVASTGTLPSRIPRDGVSSPATPRQATTQNTIAHAGSLPITVMQAKDLLVLKVSLGSAGITANYASTAVNTAWIARRPSQSATRD
ncbi:MAG: hypothetical protein ACRYHQ_18320 [Janthinobacterium lividum]